MEDGSPTPFKPVNGENKRSVGPDKELNIHNVHSLGAKLRKKEIHLLFWIVMSEFEKEESFEKLRVLLLSSVKQ